MNVPDRNVHRRNNVARRPTTPGVLQSADALFPLSDQPTTARRRKSRSPDSKTSQRSAPGQRSDAPGAVKRKKSGPLPSASVVLAPEVEMVADRGRKIKSRPPTTSVPRLNVSTENVAAASGSINQRSGHVIVKKEKDKVKVKEKEKEKEHSRTRAPSEPTLSDKKGVQSEYTGPLATAEFKRMQKEIDSLRKVVHENKKVTKKQNKIIEDLKEDLDSRIKALKEKDAQLHKSKSKSKKADELVTSIEAHMQCQICLELLLKPFVLPPCGHVLCLTCIQEWFRKAPADDDDMYDDDNSDYLLYRRKTCPCCRTVVSRRPIPIFLVKTIASTLAKAKNPTVTRSRSNRVSPSPDEDPWAGLFPPDDEVYDEDQDQDGEEDEDDDDEDAVDWAMNVFAYGSASDDEPYEGEYVPAQWEPPSVNAYPEDFPFDEAFDNGDLCMLRRGVTIEMIANYQIEYTHEDGLSVVIEDIHGANRVFLGWNIKLSGDDMTGEEYLDWVIGDIASSPERWEVTDVEDGSWEARKLVPFEEAVDYDTTDSENWIDNDDLD